jgi:hypothetical protein
VDETPVDVRMHDGSGRNHQAFLWQYGRPGGGSEGSGDSVGGGNVPANGNRGAGVSGAMLPCLSGVFVQRIAELTFAAWAASRR